MYTRFFHRIIALGFVSGAALGTAACGGEATGELTDEASISNASAAAQIDPRSEATETPTGPCTVISGVNRGRRGTFDEDGDCAGDWGMSECTNPDGSDSGKCRAGHVPVRRLPRYMPRGGVDSPSGVHRSR